MSRSSPTIRATGPPHRTLPTDRHRASHWRLRQEPGRNEPNQLGVRRQAFHRPHTPVFGERKPGFLLQICPVYTIMCPLYLNNIKTVTRFLGVGGLGRSNAKVTCVTLLTMKQFLRAIIYVRQSSIVTVGRPSILYFSRIDCQFLIDADSGQSASFTLCAVNLWIAVSRKID